MSAYEIVYKVQCQTAAILRDLWQLPDNLATRPDHPYMLFRLVPAHRCAASLKIRKMVADQVKQTRRMQK